MKTKSLTEMRVDMAQCGYHLVRVPYVKRVTGKPTHPRVQFGWRWAARGMKAGNEFTTGTTARDTYLRFKRIRKIISS